MIWTSQFLFLHAPKTGGMSITELLLGGYAGQIYITGPHDEATVGNIQYFPGRRHETLCDAESFFSCRNQSIADFEKVFVVMRNPYDMELSRYTYLRKGKPWDVGVDQDIALDGSFEEYLRSAPFFGQSPPRFDKYFHIFGRIPDNLVILRFEHINDDARRHLSPYLSSVVLAHDNRSEHLHFERAYDIRTEELCYQRHQWVFDKSFYRRLEFPIKPRRKRQKTASVSTL
jgi:hypothetical protein